MNLAFDTLTAAKKMEEVGMERVQAEVISHIIAERQGDIVTKADIADMVTKADIADMVTKTEFAEVKTDIAVLKESILALKDSVVAVKENGDRHWKLTLTFVVPTLAVILAAIVGFGTAGL